jgi:hypothetical protein
MRELGGRSLGLVAALVATALLGVLVASASAGAGRGEAGLVVIGGPGAGGTFGAQNQKPIVPRCFRKGRSFADVPIPPPQQRRAQRCDARLFGSIGALADEFIRALQRADGARACRLLTDKERARLGGPSCPTTFAPVFERVRAEREPFVDSLSFGTKPLRGEFSMVLVRPFERIGFRFEEERNRWRIVNTRDLFRQFPPPATTPPA